MGVFWENRYFLPPDNPQHLQRRGMAVGLRSLGTSEGRTNACLGASVQGHPGGLTNRQASISGRKGRWLAGQSRDLLVQPGASGDTA